MFLLHPSIFWWDLAILLLLAAPLATAVLCSLWLRRHPRRAPAMWLLVRLVQALACLTLLVIAYGSFIEPRLLVVTRRSLSLPVAQPLKIAVISDLHVGPYKGSAWVQRVVQRVNAQLPDLVLIAGDFLFDGEGDVADLAPLRDLRASMGVFAVTGNHDAGNFLRLSGEKYEGVDRTNDLTVALQDLGIDVLRNNHREVRMMDGSMVIAGVDDIWQQESDLQRALRGIAPSAPVILLSHHPDIILDPASRRASLIVAGHTHGGQFRLPFYGPIPRLPTLIGRAYDQGIFALDPTHTLAITRGAGETLARARLFAWPEILLLDITPR